jgi:threonine aldolase
MKAISAFCKSKNLLLHCDGARIFNALISLELDSSALNGLFDSISVCLSKGLGAPVGSVLLGSKTFIRKARKIRKALGGGMRQVGYLAAAGLYALDHNVNRLAMDHSHAKMLASALQASKKVCQVLPVESNIVIAEIEDSSAFAAKLALHGIKAQPFSPTQIRFVTHLDITEEMTQKTCEVIAHMN